MNRKRIPAEIETAVLTKSARRCILCYHLSGDLGQKDGQIAHLDKNRCNDREDNLGFLCLGHHTHFDSRTSQHKGYTAEEVKTARLALYSAIGRGDHHEYQARRSLDPVLELSFDTADPLCIRSWEAEVHHLYRVRVKNSGRVTAHHVVVKIEKIEPPKADFLGTQLVVCHQPGVDSVSLKPNEAKYFDLIEYNSADVQTQRPVLFLWHSVGHLRRHLPDANYDFALRAYADEITSDLLTLSFRRTSRTDYSLISQVPKVKRRTRLTNKLS